MGSDISEIPQVPQDYIDKIFEGISVMEVELDTDPLQYGPKRLNNKIAEARGYLTECESMFLQVSRLLQKFRSVHRDLEVEFEISKKHLFANDPEVQALPHVTDRDALATMKLRDQVREINALSRSIPDLEALITIIKAKRTDLKDIQGRIRDQIKLCHEEVALGGRWGSKPPPGSKAPDLDSAPDIPKQTLRDLRDMFDGSSSPEILDSKVIAPVDSEPEEPNEDFKGEDSDDTMDEFLKAIKEDSRPYGSAPNLESILDGLDL
jgi:hypothetical protein